MTTADAGRIGAGEVAEAQQRAAEQLEREAAAAAEAARRDALSSP